MKRISIIFLCLILCLGVHTPAMAAPDASWASLPTQRFRGSNNGTRYVKAIQRFMMNYDMVTYAYIYDTGLSEHGIDGSFGYGTESAVMHFQYVVGITDNGVVGTNTWQNMRNELMFDKTANGFRYYTESIMATGESLNVTFRQGTTTGNWGSRPWGVTDLTNNTSWNVFNY